MGKRLQNSKAAKMRRRVERCDLCSGELKPGKTTLEIWRGEDLILIKDVPADACRQCHEAYISASVSERLDQFMAEYQQHRPVRYVTVPEYSAAQVMGK